MKKILLCLFFVTSGLFAQQNDPPTTKELNNLENKLNAQNEKFVELEKQWVIIQENLKKLDQNYRNQNREINSLSSRIVKQDNNLKELREANLVYKSKLDSVDATVRENGQMILANSENLGSRIDQTGAAATANFSRLDQSLSRNQLIWIIAILSLLIIAGLLFYFLSKKIRSSQTDMQSQISRTKKSLEEESIKLDNKLVELLDTQLKLQKEAVLVPLASSPSHNGQDHKLALKVADEIVRIQKNLERMDDNTKGLKQLSASVKRIQDNFAANGYELVEMIGKEYNEGMKASVNFIQDEDFDENKKIITRIIKPQVNYNGTMIQTAQIEVTEA